MKLALAFLTVLALSIASPALAQTSSHVRIESTDAPALAAALAAEGFDVLPATARTTVELIVSPQELALLQARGLPVEIIARGRPFRDILAEQQFHTGRIPGYQTLSEIIGELEAAAAAYPDLCRVVDLTTTYGTPPTVEGRHLYAIKVSDHAAQDEDEPALLIVSTHHAREVVTPVIALYVLEKLTTQYGSDPTITTLVDQYEIWIAPVWNPDGYEYMYFYDNWWRKNRHVFPQGVGVDLNRNYPLGWDAWCSGSTSPGSETYKGPASASESETQTMLAWSNDRHFTKVLDYHSYGRIVVHGYACLTHPLAAFIKDEAIQLSTASGYAGALGPPSAEGEHYQWQLGLHASLAYLVETQTSFQPAYDAALAEAALVWPGVLWMLQRPIALGGHVTDAAGGQPVAAQLTIAGLVFQNGEQIRSEPRFGRYHAFLPAGSYSVTFAAPGYAPQTAAVTVAAGTAKVLDVALVRRALGDLNCDGAIDAFDIDPFVLALTDPAKYATTYPTCDATLADLNQDDKIDAFDIDPFVDALIGD